MDKNKIIEISDKIILIFLTIQIFSVSFSIALSSISFGVWGGLWILQIIIFHKLDFPLNLKKDIFIVNIFIAFYILSVILSRVFAVIPEGAFNTLKTLLLFMIFYGLIIKIKDKNIFYKILTSILIIFSLVSVYELLRYAIAFTELNKTVSAGEIRIDYLGHYLTMGEIKMLIALTVMPLIFAKGKIFINKLYLVLLLVPILISMYLTQSRNVFLALFICLLIYGIFINRRFLFYFAIFLVAFWLLIPGQFKERLTSIVDPNHPSNASRLMMWNVGLKMFADHPVTGIGDNEITTVYKMYKIPEFSGEGSHLHSNYIMILATTGLIGTIAFLGLFISLFWKQIKFYRDTKIEEDKLIIAGAILSTISLHISGFFQWNFGDWKVFTVILFIISIPYILKNLNDKLKLKEN